MRWWHWAVTNPINQPLFDAVPLPSVVVFAALWPMSLALCGQFFVGHVDRGRHFSGLELVWRTVVIGLLASLGTFVLPLPATVLGMGSATVRAVVYAVELAVVTGVGVVVLVPRWVCLRRGEPAVPPYTNRFVQVYSVVYLVVMAFLWVTALPEFLRAVHGVTSTGDPVGNLWYALACFVVAALCVAATFTVQRGGGRTGRHTAARTSETRRAPHSGFGARRGRRAAGESRSPADKTADTSPPALRKVQGGWTRDELRAESTQQS